MFTIIINKVLSAWGLTVGLHGRWRYSLTSPNGVQLGVNRTFLRLSVFKITDDDTITALSDGKDTNGEVRGLLNVNGTIYVETKTTPVDNVYTGKLIKITKDDTITILSKGNVNNGEIYSLTTSTNQNIYIGTKTGDGQGYLYKVKEDGENTVVTNGKDTNGEVLSLVNDNNTIFVGTRTTDGKGRLFKVVYTVAIGIFSGSSSGGEVHSWNGNTF